MTDAVAGKLAALEGLDKPALRVQWQEAFGRPAPTRASRELLLRALAYRLQEELLGGLPLLLRKQLARGLKGSDRAAPPPQAPPPGLKPGTRLVREWNGAVHEVEVLDDGFFWREETYSNLSQIARAITGTRWSGPRFFGLKA